MATYSLAQIATQKITIATAQLAATDARNADMAAQATSNAASGELQKMLQQNALDVLNGEPPAA